jgi:hypothetical protein
MDQTDVEAGDGVVKAPSGEHKSSINTSSTSATDSDQQPGAPAKKGKTGKGKSINDTAPVVSGGPSSTQRPRIINKKR